ncbi:MAG: PQQ-like beta-propeller repeat protein [Pirellulales bacterium]|nr:PQQ-like beta-propeller repeat protein [Pirellulales bacterium]
MPATLVFALILAGCGAPPGNTAPPSDATQTKTSSAPASATIALPEDLGTRKAGEDWPCFLGPTHDSRSSETGLVTPWPRTGPPVLWHRRLGTGYGAPTISRGRLFVFDRVGDFARLACCESETGKELWKFEYPTAYEDLYGYNNGPRCSPVVDGDRVYLYGAEGMLHCLNIVDGSLRWKVDTTRDYNVVQNFFGVGSTPLLEGDLLLVQVGGSVPGRGDIMSGNLLPNGTALVAFDKFTGKEKYRTGDELASYSSPIATTLDGRRWGFLFARGGLLGFDPASGKVDFHYPWRAKIAESVNASTPVLVGNRAFISECYGPGSSLLQYSPGKYELLWADDPRRRDKAMQTHWNTCVYHEGVLYGSSGRHAENAELRAIDLDTGQVRWSEPNLSRSSLLYVDRHFVCLTEYGELILLRATPEKFDVVSHSPILDLKAGAGELAEPSPQQLIRYPAWAAPILSHGLMYIRDENRLVCLELIPEKN